MQQSWFAVRTKSNREASVADALAGKGFDVLYPRCRVHGQRGPENRKDSDAVLRPLFPGYLFCRFDVLIRLPVLTVPGVVNIVSVGRQPAPLDNSEVESIRILLNSSLPISPHSYLTIGDQVAICDGPLTGASGYIVQADTRRLVVSITLLQRSVSVDVPETWLVKHMADKSPATALQAASYARSY